MGFKIEDGNDTTELTITDGEAHVRLTRTEENAGYVAIATENDAGLARSNARYMGEPEATRDSRLRIAIDTVLFDDSFPGAALSSAVWQTTLSTMTVAVASGRLSLNSGNSLASAAVARVQSYATFPLYGSAATYLEFDYANTGGPQTAGHIVEIGFGYAATTATPTVGAYFKWDGDVLRAVLNFNGTEVTSDVAVAYTPAVGDFAHYVVEWTEDAVVYWVDDIAVAIIERPSTNGNATVIRRLPILFRHYNNGAVAQAIQPQLSSVSVGLGEMDAGIMDTTRAAISGRSTMQGQPGGTMGSTANYANSAAPAAATLSNTAAGYTTLGGQFAFAAPAGAETDYALFGWQNPAGSASALGQNALIRRVRIDSVNVGAAVATTATVVQWGIGVGSTAVSLATAEAAATRAPRRLAMGVQSWVVGAAIGASAEALYMDFDPPLLVEPGTFFHVICKVPVGTATASQQIRGTVAVIGDFQ